MSEILKAGSDWLSDKLKSKVGTSVVYHRGANNVTVTATVGSTEFIHGDPTGVVERIESRDYLIDAADLIISGSVTTPKRGDTVVETQGSSTYTYEVMTLDNEPAWRYSDPYRRKLRVHTKQITVA